MRSLLAVTMGLGFLAAAPAGAMAACAGHDDVTAEAPMTPIVTADTSGPSTPVVTDDEKKG